MLLKLLLLLNLSCIVSVGNTICMVDQAIKICVGAESWASESVEIYYARVSDNVNCHDAPME